MPKSSARSEAAQLYHRWYKTARWKRLRAAHLARNPYCQCPHHDGQKIPANTVDHHEPHRGDARLFWNPGNLRSMTKPCHDAWKQSQERGGAGFLSGCDERGWPLSEEHGWHE